MVENPLDVLHPLIPFNEGPSKYLINTRSYSVKPWKTNRCRDSFVNKCNAVITFHNYFLYIVKLSNSVHTANKVFNKPFYFYF